MSDFFYIAISGREPDAAAMAAVVRHVRQECHGAVPNGLLSSFRLTVTVVEGQTLLEPFFGGSALNALSGRRKLYAEQAVASLLAWARSAGFRTAIQLEGYRGSDPHVPPLIERRLTLSDALSYRAATSYRHRVPLGLSEIVQR